MAELALNLSGHTITAALVRSQAVASCGNNGAAATGSSELVDLTIDGQVIAVTASPNQTVSLDGLGEVVINEQTSTGPGDITVNALHVTLPDIDLIVSQSHADITCGSVPPQPTPTNTPTATATPPGHGHHKPTPTATATPGPPPNCQGDFLTGGGFIIASDQAKANFGVAGGSKVKNDGFLFGHLEYIDHGSNAIKVHGTGVTSYTLVNGFPNCRQIDGNCEINGTSGSTYTVVACDNGEPGRGVDTFSINLSNSYSASNVLGGGNIQLHQKPNGCP